MIAYDDYYLVPSHLLLGAVFIILFLLKGGLSTFQKTSTKQQARFSLSVLVYTALFLTIIAGINYYTTKHELFYFDSTKENVYTLAPQTKKVIKNLSKEKEAHIIIRAFYLGGVIEPDVKALLDRYSKESSLVSWKLIDPEKKPLEVKQHDITESETISISYYLRGSVREGKVIGTVNEERITNTILKLTRGEAKKVYYLLGHSEPDIESGTQTGYLLLKQALEGENLNVHKLELKANDKIPEDASALLIVAPRKELLPFEEKAISDYLNNDGNALLLNEPSTTSVIKNLVKPFGITVGENIIVDQVVQLFAGPGLGVQPLIEHYGDHPITKDFTERTIYSTVSSVSPTKESNSVTVLAKTSEHSWAETNLELLLGNDPQAEKSDDDLSGPVSIAVAYENKEGKPGRIVVIGDADFVANVNIRQTFNRDFILNAINWVVGIPEDITIRAGSLRQSVEPLSTGQFNTMFILCSVLFPEILLLIGITIWWKRKL